MNEDRRQHRLYILFPLFSALKGLIPVLFIWYVKGFPWENIPWYIYLGAPLLLTAVCLGYGWLRWRRNCYTLENDRIMIRQGLLFYEEKTLYISKIHSLNTEQPVVQRLLGIVQAQFEVPGGKKKSDGVLPALSAADAGHLQTWLHEGQHHNRDTGTGLPEAELLSAEYAAPYESSAEVLLRLTASDLLKAALSTLNLSLAVVFFAGVYSFADDLLPDGMYQRMFASLGQYSTAGWLLILLGVLVFSWLLSAILFTVKYAGFTMERADGQIRVTYGLLDRKRHLFKPERVQAVIVKEGLLRQLLGCCEVQLRLLSSDTEQGLMLHPLIRRKDVPLLIAGTLPHYGCHDVQFRPPVKARWFYIRWKLLAAAASAAAGILYLGFDGVWAVLFLPLSIWWGWACWANTGAGLDGKQLTMSFRRMARFTVWTRRSHVVEAAVSTTAGQRRRGLQTFSVHLMLKASAYRAPGLEREHAQAARAWLRG
ncbi:PH domain-containing protein [Paenibacillus lacisoli]|nr:PH domain-containing protein [Paenibacillus sp. JX-17]